MSDFSFRSDSVDVEQIMSQIRARVREKRGVDYTEEEIRELANVKLEKFLDPGGIRSDLLEQYRRAREATPIPRNYAFEDTTLFESHRGLVSWIRKVLRPILKLFFNPQPIADTLNRQAKLNESFMQFRHTEALYYELIHNLVLETTRTGIEVKNLRMRVDSMSSRLDFDERRARSLEGVVQYRPGAVAPQQPPTGPSAPAGPAAAGSEADAAERRTRRRRRRGKRRPDQQGASPDGAASDGFDGAGEAAGSDAPDADPADSGTGDSNES